MTIVTVLKATGLCPATEAHYKHTFSLFLTSLLALCPLLLISGQRYFDLYSGGKWRWKRRIVGCQSHIQIWLVKVCLSHGMKGLCSYRAYTFRYLQILSAYRMKIICNYSASLITAHWFHMHNLHSAQGDIIASRPSPKIPAPHLTSCSIHFLCFIACFAKTVKCRMQNESSYSCLLSGMPAMLVLSFYKHHNYFSVL